MEIQIEVQNVFNCLSNLNRQVKQNSFKNYTLNQYIDRLLNYTYIENLCLGKIDNITHDTPYHYFSDLIKIISKINKSYISHLIQLQIKADDKNIFKDSSLDKQVKDRLSLGLKTQEKLNPTLFGNIQTIYNREYLQAFEKFFDNLGFSLLYAQRLEDHQVAFKENLIKKEKPIKRKKFCQKTYERQLQAQSIFQEIEENCYENFNEIKDPLLLIEISKMIVKQMQNDQNLDFMNIFDEESIKKNKPGEKSSTDILEEVAHSFNYQFAIISQLRKIKNFQNVNSENQSLNQFLEKIYNKFKNFQMYQIQQDNINKIMKQNQNRDKDTQTDEDLQFMKTEEDLQDQKSKNLLMIQKLRESQAQVNFLQEYQKELKKKYDKICLEKQQMEEQNSSQIQQNLDNFHQNNIIKNHLHNVTQKYKKQKQILQNFFQKSNTMLEKLFFGFDINKKLKNLINNPKFDCQVICSKLLAKIDLQVQKKSQQYNHKNQIQQDEFYFIFQNKSISQKISIGEKIIIYSNNNHKRKNKYSVKRKTKVIKRDLSQQKPSQSPSKKKPKKIINNYFNKKNNNQNRSKKSQILLTQRDHHRKSNFTQKINTNENQSAKQRSSLQTDLNTNYRFINKSIKLQKSQLYAISESFQIMTFQNQLVIISNNIGTNKTYCNLISNNKNHDQNFLGLQQNNNQKNFKLQSAYFFNQNKQHQNKLKQAQMSVKSFSKIQANQTLLKSSREVSNYQKRHSKSQKLFFTFRHKVNAQRTYQWKVLNKNKTNRSQKPFRIQLNSKSTKNNFKQNLNQKLDEIYQYLDTFSSFYNGSTGINNYKKKDKIEQESQRIFQIFCKQIYSKTTNQNEQEYINKKVKKLIKKFSEDHQCERGCNHEKIFLDKIQKLQKFFQKREILKLPKYNINGHLLIKKKKKYLQINCLKT